jgi:hypothetical protein
MQLLNELQPKFLELTKAHAPGGPTIEMETYGPQHVTGELPPIKVTAPNGDPTNVCFSTTAPNNNTYELIQTAPPDQGFVNGPIPGSETPGLSYLLVGITAAHAAQLEVTNVTVTATDTVTDKSTSTSFKIIGLGEDKTLPPDSFPSNPGDSVIIPQEEVFNHYEQLSQSGNLNPGQSFQSLAALIDQYAAAGFHYEHVGAGQMPLFPDKQDHHASVSFVSNPHHG